MKSPLRDESVFAIHTSTSDLVEQGSKLVVERTGGFPHAALFVACYKDIALHQCILIALAGLYPSIPDFHTLAISGTLCL